VRGEGRNGGAGRTDFSTPTHARYIRQPARKANQTEQRSRRRVAAWNSRSGARKEELGGAGVVVVVAAELAAGCWLLRLELGGSRVGVRVLLVLRW